MLFIKRNLRRIYESVIYLFFLRQKSILKSGGLLKLNALTSEVDIITIAFNNALMVEFQIQLIQQNIEDKFSHIIADNSSDQNTRKSIWAVCQKLGALYVSVPTNGFVRNKSHAAAMGWIYKNVIKKRNNKYFGFIDHDIFPIKPFSIIANFKGNIYGRVIPPYGPDGKSVPTTLEQPYWSLWAGLLFLKAELLYGVHSRHINFFPRTLYNGIYLDTAGGLWDTVLKKIPYPGEIVKYSSIKFRQSEKSNIHTDYYECLDDWIHIVNLSNWYATPNMKEKIKFFEELLTQKLNPSIKI